MANLSSTELQELPSVEELISGAGITAELYHQRVSRPITSGTADKDVGTKKQEEDPEFV